LTDSLRLSRRYRRSRCLWCDWTSLHTTTTNKRQS